MVTGPSGFLAIDLKDHLVASGGIIAWIIDNGMGQREHLADDGLLIINIFDPKLEWLTIDGDFPETPLRKHLEFIHPVTGNRVVIWNTRKHDLERQTIDEDRTFEEIDGDGRVISKSYAKLALRFTYRYEMQYLFELSGFRVENLYGDFQRGDFRYGGEQIWVARKVS